MTGSGTQADPFIIYNVTDLQAMESNLGSYYELGGDIDASATTGWSDADGTGFIPVGQAGYFTGNFDGKGYTISNLFMKRTYTECGLFQQAQDATIKNVALTDVDFTADDDGGAGIVAYRAFTTTITDCSVTGSITCAGYYVGGIIGRLSSGTITSCSSSCTISSSGNVRYTGGIIGYMANGTISDCYSTGNITSTGNYVGGFVGYFAGGTIDQCYSTGTVIGVDDTGGFVGFADGTSITNCYARGNATNTGGSNGCGGFAGGGYTGCTLDDCYSIGVPAGGAYTGGFIGYGSATITNCFWDTETSGTETSDGGTGKTTAQMKTQSTFGNVGWNFVTIWYITSSINNGYPSLGKLGGELAGLYAVVEERFHYVDAYGVERFIQGTAV